MGREAAVPTSKALVPAALGNALPRRRPRDRARTRPLAASAERGLFDYLDEHSSTFWAAYYAALATTSTAASVRALDRSAANRPALVAAPPALDPAPVTEQDFSDLRFGMPAPGPSLGGQPLERRPSLFERPTPTPTRRSPLPDCPACGAATELSFLDLDSGGMSVVCESCGTEASSDGADASVARTA